MNRATRLVWYCKTPRGWRRFPALITREPGRLPVAREGWVKDHGTETEYPEGRFEIVQYNQDRKKVYTRVEGKEPLIDLNRASRTLLQRHGNTDEKTVLKKAVKAYIEDCKARKALEAAEQAERVLREFVPLCNVTYVRGIKREDILAFHSALRKRGCTDRTVANKHQRLRAFLRFCEIDVKKLMPPMPKFEKGLPTIYTREEIATLLKHADDYKRLMIEMGLKLGLREQEIIYAEFSDIDWQHSVYRVQGKNHWGFKVKDSEQRDVPISADLLDHLKSWHEEHPRRKLILATSKNTPSRHLLRTLKRLAKRAGMNPEDFSLHKFRRTYLTTLLRNGFDLRTVQSYAGHADLSSTMRYLRPSEAKEAHSKLNQIEWN